MRGCGGSGVWQKGEMLVNMHVRGCGALKKVEVRRGVERESEKNE